MASLRAFQSRFGPSFPKMSTRQDERLMNTLESTGVQPALPVSNVLVAAQTDVGGDRSVSALLDDLAGSGWVHKRAKETREWENKNVRRAVGQERARKQKGRAPETMVGRASMRKKGTDEWDEQSKGAAGLGIQYRTEKKKKKKKGEAAVCSTLQRRIGLASSVIAAPEETAPGTGCELRWGRTRIKSRWCGRVPGLQRCTGIGRSNEYKERRRSTKSPHRCRQIPVNCKEVPVISVIISTKCNGFNCHEGFAVVANCWRHLAQGIAYEVAAT